MTFHMVPPTSTGWSMKAVPEASTGILDGLELRGSHADAHALDLAAVDVEPEGLHARAGLDVYGGPSSVMPRS